MLKFIVRYGWRLLWGWSPPAGFTEVAAMLVTPPGAWYCEIPIPVESSWSFGVRSVPSPSDAFAACVFAGNASQGDGIERTPKDQLLSTGIGISQYQAPGGVMQGEARPLTGMHG